VSFEVLRPCYADQHAQWLDCILLLMAITQPPEDDLRDLKPDLVMRSLLRILVGQLSQKPAAFFTRNALRLIDQAVAEYQTGTVEIRRHIRRKDIGAFLRAQGHFENCIMSMHRALEFLAALRRFGTALDRKPLVPRSNQLDILTPGARNRIRRLRHAISHMDERLKKHPPRSGQPIALDPNNLGLTLEGVQIAWTELARWLRELYRLAGC